MNKLFVLTKRNIKIFFSNKSNLFFSSLSLIILVILHFMVFRTQNADALLSTGIKFSDKWAYWFSDTLMLSSLLPIAGITISLTSLAQIVADKEKNIINDLYVSPISKITLLFGYLLSSMIINICLILVYLICLSAYFYFSYGVFFTLLQFFSIIGVMLLSSLLGNLFVLIIISFVKREQAMGAVGTILGTLMGFVCGAYIPVSLMGDTVLKIFTCLPFLPLTAISRVVFFLNVDSTLIPPEILNGEMAEIYGYELFFRGDSLSTSMLVLIVVFYIILFSIFNMIRFNQMKNND